VCGRRELTQVAADLGEVVLYQRLRLKIEGTAVADGR
jgi:hypothetical protein